MGGNPPVSELGGRIAEPLEPPFALGRSAILTGALTGAAEVRWAVSTPEVAALLWNCDAVSF